MSAIEELREAIDELTQSQLKENGPRIFNTAGISELIDRIENEYMELPEDCNGEVVNVGDMVAYPWNDKGKFKVIAIIDSQNVLVSGYYHLCARDCELVKPEPPDSMEQIKADAVKSDWGYWECTGYACDFCSAKRASLDGKTPMAKYGEDNCEYCMHLDLVARTEKLLGGGE